MLAWTRTAVALLAFWFLGLGAAQGAWRAVEGMDAASGKPSLLLIGELDARTGLYARCVDGHAEMYLDGFDGGDLEIAPVGPVNLIITSDTGKSWSSEARYGREKSGYVTTTWLTRETISAAVAELVAAKSAISISIEFAETGDVSVWETDATGSTAAGKRFLEACPQTQFSGLPEPVAPPPAAQPATQPADAGSVALPEMTLELDESGPVLRLKGRLDDKHVLTFNCDGNGSIVVIANDGQESAPSPDRAFRLSIGINGGAPWVGTAKLARLAPGYMGYYSVPEGSGMWKLLVAVMEASGRFDIGLEDAATGEVLRWSKTPIGFGTPVYQYYTQCLLSTFSEPPASAPEAEPTWQTIITTSAEAMLVGALEPNARLVATCDIDKNVTLSLVAADLPYQIGDVGLNLYLEIDGEDRSSTGEAFDASEGLKGVAYTGDYVAAAIQAIATARTGIKLKVQNYADGSLVEWSAPDLEGLAGATESFNATCFGTATGETVADAPTTTPAAPVWIYRQQTTADGAASYLLTGYASDGSSLAFHCVPGRITSIGLFAPQGLLPGAQGDSLMLSVAIDGVNEDLFADVVAGGDGLDLLFNGAAPDAVERILTSLRDGADKIDAFVTNQGTGGITIHRFVAEGASKESNAFVGACGG